MVQGYFNPQNMKRYFGKTFVTASGSEYSLSLDGRIMGRPSIDRARVKFVAGVDNKHYGLIYDCLNTSEPKLKERLDDLILEYGEEIKPGLSLVVSLTPEYVKEKNRYGMITSTIVEIK